MIKQVTTVVSLLLLFFSASAQDRCGTPPELFLKKYSFENWIQDKQFQKALQHVNDQEHAEVYRIPVVVHIIHNGEDLGSGGNLTDAKIQEQIDILNDDFRRTNADASNTPDVFLPFAADVEVEFVLAKQDPNGNATNGIIRKQGSQASYSLAGDVLLKEESYWPSEDYFNIWVSQLNFLGWATFPETSLSGITNPETNRLYDGVAIDADWWGINDDTGGSFESFGRTMTHEVGHFLGLRHIWGDGDCGASDFCDDTPPAIDDNGGLGSPCTFGQNTCSNDSPNLPDMFMNYMDYTDDVCMNLFTNDQKLRIRTVIENSPRRLSLTTSKGLESPTSLRLDLAMGEISGVPIITCGSEIKPSLALTNLGLDEITTFKLTYTIANLQTTVTVTGVSIPTGTTYNLEIDVTGLAVGSNEISWEIIEVNGSSDENATNDLSSSSLEVQPEAFIAPFKNDFTSNQWNEASDQIPEWQMISLEQNPSIYVDAFEKNTEIDSWLVSPVFDMTDFDEAGLFFRMSYGIRSGITDRLEVRVSTSCSDDFQTVFSVELRNLFFPGSATAWIPTEDTDWLSRFVDLSEFAGSDEVRLAFVFTNNGGNNFYLDDIELTNNRDPEQPRVLSGGFIVYPSPAQQSFKVTVGLPELQTIRMQLIDMSGAVVMDYTYDNVLNQTFPVEAPTNYGLYFLRITGKDINQTRRILINR